LSTKSWTGKPLRNKTILVTRAETQAAELKERLEQIGARVLDLPTIRIVRREKEIAELAGALDKIHEYSWLILTSVNSVLILDEILQKKGDGWRLIQDVPVACIGSSTAQRVRQLLGKEPIVPPIFQAENLATELVANEIRGKRILLPRATGSRRILVDVLTEHGAIVHEIYIYETELPPSSHDKLKQILAENKIDFITLTSSSTVHNFFAMAADFIPELARNQTQFAVIGPITAATLRQYGISSYIEAARFTMEGLIEAIVNSIQLKKEASPDPQS
jgi:uroporphyrinogen III methyltransferase / synthase